MFIQTVVLVRQPERVVKAFFSYSSSDSDLVERVYQALEPHCVWLDRAEIDLGDRFIEQIESAIEKVSDFVLFWSRASSKSEWVKLELDMAFIRAMNERAVRIHIVRLDDTPLLPRLLPFQYFSVFNVPNPAEETIGALREALSQPGAGVRHRFLNRNEDLERIETMINHPDIKIVILRGFMGSGKAALANEALRRFFEDASIVDVPIKTEVGPTELALRLHHEIHREIASESVLSNALVHIKDCVKAIVARGQFMVLRDVQRWLDEESRPEQPLTALTQAAVQQSGTSRKPMFLTSTRNLRLPAKVARYSMTVSVKGLATEHVATLIMLWHELATGRTIDSREVTRVAEQVHGHPLGSSGHALVLGQLAASLVAQYGADHLLQYPAELVALRRDLAKAFLQDLRLGDAALKLMEALAMIATPVPSRVLAEILGFSDDVLHKAVAEATETGVAEVTGVGQLTAHPLVADYFWRSHLDRENYQGYAASAAQILHQYLNQLSTGAPAAPDVLRAVVRLFGLGGMVEQSLSVRSDFTGEFSHIAITHYNRRRYDLAERYMQIVLDAEPKHWRIRNYLVRIHIRRQRWESADKLIHELLEERPGDVGVQHLDGWRWLREGKHDIALRKLMVVLAHREHVASLRDAAECLYQLDRRNEALEFLERAKRVESDNAYTLELEARIHEDAGDYDKALAAMRVATLRNPTNWGFRHRLGRIYNSLGKTSEALVEAQEAVRLDEAQFVSRSTLVSLLLDMGDLASVRKNLTKLEGLVNNAKERDLYHHLKARELLLMEEFEEALRIVRQQIEKGRNLAASLGLLATILVNQFERTPSDSLASASIFLIQAKEALQRCSEQDNHDEGVVDHLQNRILRCEKVLSTLENA